MTHFKILLWTRNHSAGNNNLPPFYWLPLTICDTLAEVEELVAGFSSEAKYKIEKL